MTIYVTITKCEKKTQTWNDIDRCQIWACLAGGWNKFNFFNQLSNLNLLSHGSMKKEYSGFIFPVRRQFGTQQVGILIVFHAA